MKRFMVTDIRWASEGELSLPLWEKWNRKNPLPRGFWQRIWEYPYLVSKIPSSADAVDIGGTYPFVLFKNYPRALSVDNRELDLLDHPLHRGKWPAGKLVISDAARTPFADDRFDYSFSISAIEEMPHTFEVLKEMLRIARYRVVVTMDVSDQLGLPLAKIHELEEFLGCHLPALPVDTLRSDSRALRRFGQRPSERYKHIRVLAFTLDAVDTPRSVAILIPHWESYQFLNPCLQHIEKQRNGALLEKVYVLDDQSGDGSFERGKKDFAHDPRIEFHQIVRPNKNIDADVGLLLDEGLKLVKEQFVVMLDADTIPLSGDWISFPLWLLEKYRCSSVGYDSGLSHDYYHDAWAAPLWQPEQGYPPSTALYDNEWFTITNNLYRIMRTADARVVSEGIGFTRANGSRKTLYKYLRGAHHLIMKKGGPLRRIYRALFRGTPLRYAINNRYPYLPNGCDNGVAANHFIDINRLGPKFNIPVTSFIGITPSTGVFGQNIAGLLFHFALSTRALSRERREVGDAGPEYMQWVKRLSAGADCDDALIMEMIRASGSFKPGGYDGTIPVDWYRGLFDGIQQLGEEYRVEKKRVDDQ